MRMMKQYPRYHVVSVRISEPEKAMLTRLSIKNKLSISDVCRDALYLNLFNSADSDLTQRDDEKLGG